MSDDKKPATLVGFQVLSVEPGGSSCRVGFEFVSPVGEPMNALVAASPEALSHMALAVFANGIEFHKAGAPADMGGESIPEPIECNRLGIASTNGTDTIMVLQFGSMVLPVKVATQSIRSALSLLDSGASGSLMPGSPDRH